MSTTTKSVSRPQAVLKLPEYKVPLLITYARSILRAVTGNPRFPSPQPPLATLKAAVDALEAAETATRTRMLGTVQARDDRRLALVILLGQLCNHVQATADSDADHGASIIESAGIAVKKSRALPARVFAAKRGRVSGSVNLSAPKAGNRAGYEWAYSIDREKTWVSAPFTVRASTTVSGLEPGLMVHFRYRAVTKDGTGDWSQPVSAIIV
jgi:hypothetical protein